MRSLLHEKDVTELVLVAGIAGDESEHAVRRISAAHGDLNKKYKTSASRIYGY